MSFYSIKLTSSMFESAKKRDKEGTAQFGKINTVLVKNDNIRKSGFVGEQVVKEFFPELNFANSTQFDFLLNGTTFEVKTRGGNIDPRKIDSVYVHAHQAHRKFDYLIFIKILNDFSTGFFLGFLSKPEFFERAKLLKKGEFNGRFTLDSDRYSVLLSDLRPAEELESIILNLAAKRT